MLGAPMGAPKEPSGTARGLRALRVVPQGGQNDPLKQKKNVFQYKMLKNNNENIWMSLDS